MQKLKFSLEVFNNDDEFLANSVDLQIDSEDVLRLFGFDPRVEPGDLELISEEDIRKLDGDIEIDLERYCYFLGVRAAE